MSANKKRKNETKTKDQYLLNIQTYTLVATFIIAVSGLWQNYIGHRNLNQQEKYYSNTIRPFVSFSEPRFSYVFSKKDTLVQPVYKIKNFGSQPAKLNFISMILHSDIDKKIFIKMENDSSLTTSYLYPNNEHEIFYRNGFIDREILEKSPYVHFLIKYEDLGGQKYYTKDIRLLKLNQGKDPDHKVAMIWADAN
ncbi:hypothetical protein GF406_04555 [candidate division KSB1 bacterium]|nr:hypothetical protein [candidate division KSB1 bacterium]